MERLTVGMYRIEPEQVALNLPQAFALCRNAAVSIPRLVFAAAVVGAASPARDLEGAVASARAITGDDYADGFLDGFACACGERGRGRRYVQGLDDAASLRDALRRLDSDWAWALLERTQPQL